MKLYDIACLGGTFELIHKGHEKLIEVAFSLADKVVIGITSDNLVKSLGKKHPVSPYEVRVKRLKEYLSKKGLLNRAIIVKLNDPYGPSIHDPNIKAIVVSEETLKRALEIYKIRQKKGLPPISIITVKLVLAKNGRPISTTRILRGEITCNGKIIK
ncbi:MAG: hypothetical protein DRJ66_00935 [Thermoprotei archaeon]|nr:MAG: hypothetical protein DRJ66_00935 [Thermoprotei archaeon]RLF17694.1 MAG: hypothetical protein DRZ82_09610 [Thermoprotei archaeon]